MAFVVGGLVAVAFWLVGLVCVLQPGRVQRADQNAQRGVPWVGVYDTAAYAWMLRTIGILSLAVAVALTTGMVLFALGYLER